MHHHLVRALLTLLVLVTSLAACGAGAASTPSVARVAAPGDAAALVIASNPMFAGTMERRPDVIGASRWWTAEPLASGGYRVEVTVGWGDCPAGCIEHHVWTFDVDASGSLKLVGESGDPVPSDLPV